MTESNETAAQKVDPLVGQIFEGRFQILSALGRGGMGMVYKARHVHMGKDVAIKMLVSTVYDDRTFLRFEQEARAASSLAHPNIISIYDFGRSAQGLAYLVMEYLEGRTLEDVIVDEEISIPRFERIFTQVCEGMQHAHKKGIIHRDLKPTNLMIIDTEDAKDVVRIVDFGLAKLNNEQQGQQLTHEGTVVGSPAFMSPEQCRGDELDSRTDIYSLGCVMYTSLGGQVPHMGTNSMATIFKHISDEPVPLSKITKQLVLPLQLEQVIMQTLSKNPDERPQTMAELGKAISDAVHDKRNAIGATPTRLDIESASSTRAMSSPMKQGALPTGPRIQAEADTSVSKVNTEKLKHDLIRGHSDTRVVRADQDNSSIKNGSSGYAITGVAVLLAGLIGIGTWTMKQSNSSSSPQKLTAANANNSSPTTPPVVPVASADTPKAEQKDPSKQLKLEQTPDWQSPSGQTSKTPLATTQLTPANPTTNQNTGTEKTSSQSSHDPIKTAESHNPQIATIQDLSSSTHSTQDKSQSKTQPQDHSLVKKEASISKTHANNQATSPGTSEKKRQALVKAEEYTTQGNLAFNQKDYPTATSYLEKAVSESEYALGAKNVQQLPILARLVASLRNQEDYVTMTRYLDMALTIIKNSEKHAVQEINGSPTPITIWRPLANGCFEAGMHSSDESSKQRFFQWSSELYFLAEKSLNGEKNSDYYKMLRTHMAVAKQLGDTQLQRQLGRQLRLGGGGGEGDRKEAFQTPREMIQNRFRRRQQAQ